MTGEFAPAQVPKVFPVRLLMNSENLTVSSSKGSGWGTLYGLRTNAKPMAVQIFVAPAIGGQESIGCSHKQ